MKREAIIEGALQELGVLAVGETASASDNKVAIEALDSILDELSDRYMWSRERQDDVVYIAGNTVDMTTYGKAHTVKVLAGNAETYLGILTEPQWMAIPDKTVTGTMPTHIHVDSEGIGHLYPVPTVDGTIRVFHNKAIPPSAAGVAPEIPLKWGRALQIGVAHELSVKYGLAVQDRMDLERRWVTKREKLLASDVCLAPISLEVDD